MKTIMNQNPRRFRVLLSIAAILSVAMSATLAGKRTTPQVVPPNATYHGESYAEWSAAAAKFSMEHPLEGHPALDTPGVDIRSGQQGEVWFLGGPFGTHERSISVPSGKALFVILLNAECSSLESEESGFHGDTEAEQRACAKFWTDHIVNVGCTIDGEAVANMGEYRASSPQFSFNAPTPWLFGDIGGSGTSVVDGYYVMIEPLPKGEHTIHFTGTFHFTMAEDGFDQDLPADMTYHVNSN